MMTENPRQHHSLRTGDIRGIAVFRQISSQQWSDLIQIGRVKLGKINQTVIIVKPDMAIAERQQPFFAQLPQNTVYMHRTEANRIGQKILRQRTGKAGFIPHTHQREPRTKLEQEMRHTLRCITTANVHQMFDRYRIIPRRGPKDREGKARSIGKGFQQVRFQNLRHLDIGNRFDAGRAQEQLPATMPSMRNGIWAARCGDAGADTTAEAALRRKCIV